MLKKLLLPVLLFLCSFHAQAGYLAGADFQYKCLGGDSFRVILKVYADCRDSSLGGTCSIKIFPLNCPGASFNKTFTRTSVKDVTPLCSTSSTYCNGGTVVGIQTHTYEGNIHLSAFTSCCLFRISYEAAERHSGIGTGQAYQNLCVQALINKCITPCNSSPVFDDLPHTTLAPGQDQKISFSAVDTLDHDSLVFSLDYPLQSAGMACTYSSGYSKYCPLKFLGFGNPNASLPAGFHLNDVTGLMEFRPTQVQMAVVPVKASEYRNINGIPTLVGEITRDFMFTISSSPSNRIPEIKAAETNFKVCIGGLICFKMYAIDKDTSTGDSTELFFWNHGITGLYSFDRSGTKTDTAQFCWEPGLDQGSTLPYYFTFTAKDKGCPFNSYTSKVFSVLVYNNYIIEAQPVKSISCRTVSFNPGITNAPKNLAYSWSGAGGFSSKDSLPVFTYAANGTYPYSVWITSPHNCDSFYYEDTVVINTITKVGAGADTIVCSGSSITLNATPLGGKAPFSYNWNNGLSNAKTFSPTIISDKLFIVAMTDSTGCTAFDTLQARVFKAAGDAGPNRSVCANWTPVSLGSGTPAGGTWNGPGVTAGAFNPIVTGTGNFKLFYVFQDSNGCSYKDSMEMKVNNLPVVDAGNGRRMCTYYNPLVLAGTPPGGTWSGAGVSGNKFTAAVAGVGTFELRYLYTDMNGCKNSDTIMILVDPDPVADFTATPLSGSGTQFVNFTDKSTGAIRYYTWDFGDPASGNANYSSVPNPFHLYKTAGSYRVGLRVEHYCSNTVFKTNYINIYAVGMDENIQKQLQLYPNPSNGDVTLSLENTNGEKFSLHIYDNLGRQVFEETGITENYLIKKNTLQAGIYQVRLSAGSGNEYHSTLVIE